ncbi:hypothetical protein L596_011368 [Steinernema carpocapsae]|uniref:Tyrosine-protein kinase n=1 Tax=Steinernema carpocapsae TaxID=34508 RepID=A0A4U5NUG1_STECR|nr:hypothetical protein L596_011368 [Steinernema carpocapsae]
MADAPSTRKKGVSQNIEDQQWYHGLRSRADIEPLLQVPGDWLVRATESRNKTEIVISVRSERKGISNLTILFDGGQWQLGVLQNNPKAKKFNSIYALIAYYKINNLPGHLKLVRAISRPKWLMKHESIKFDKSKDLIGSGNFCDVYKGYLERKGETALRVAIKVCHNAGVSPNDRKNQTEAMDSMLHEAKIMSYYSHENVIQFYGVACDHHPIMIVMEYCPGGSLESHLKRMKKDVETGERVLYCLEASKGMRYLHDQNCLHRDLAARNCLISAKGVIKIADFGLSKMVGELNDVDPKAQQIPIRWMAPETLQRASTITKKSDVWSYGVLVFEIFNQGEKPWPNDPVKKIATHIRRGEMMSVPELAPQQIREYLQRIWNLNPEQRPTFKEIVTYLSDLSKNQIRPPAPEKSSMNQIPGVHKGPVVECMEQRTNDQISEIEYNQNTADTETSEMQALKSTALNEVERSIGTRKPCTARRRKSNSEIRKLKAAPKKKNTLKEH